MTSRHMPRRSLLLAAPAALALPTVLRAAPERPAPITFTVFRGASQIGTHRVEFLQGGPDPVVEISIDLVVRFAGIPVYRYTHRSREEWSGDRLRRLDSSTDDSGTRTEVRARAVADGLAVEGSGGSFLAPADIKPTSYWMEDMTRRSRLLNTQEGIVIDVAARQTGTDRLTIAGTPVDIRVYEVTGDLNTRVGYAGSGDWVDLEFAARGSTIRYRRDRLSLGAG
jgi:hypothetical protein